MSESFDVSGEPLFGYDPVARTLFVKMIPKEFGRQEIYEVVQKIPGF